MSKAKSLSKWLCDALATCVLLILLMLQSAKTIAQACQPAAFSVCPANISVNTTTVQCNAIVNYTVTVTGDPALAVSYTFAGATIAAGSGTGSGSGFNKGLTTVTITATNSCGSAQCTFTVLVTDNQPPTINCAANITIKNIDRLCFGLTTLAKPVVSDNCNLGNGITVTNNAPATYPIGNTTVTWTATDASGNSVTCDQIVTVIEVPVIGNGSSNIPCLSHRYDLNNTYADASGGPSLVPAGGTLGPFDYTFAPNQGLSISNAIDPYTYSITLKFKASTVTGWRKLIDFKNRTADAGFYIFNGALQFYPVITGPVSIAANTDVCVVITRNGADNKVTGYVNGVQQWSFIDNTGYATFTAANNIIQIFKDDGGTEATGGVLDDVKIFNCAIPINDVEIACNTSSQCADRLIVNNTPGLCFASPTLTVPAVSYLCSIRDITGITVTNNAPPTYPIGNTFITYTATDVSGNTNSCIQGVTVVDNQPPSSITCAPNITFNNTPGICFGTTTLIPPTVIDNCSTTLTNNAPASFPVGNTTVTWTATDAGGNTISCNQIVTVVDNQPPIISFGGLSFNDAGFNPGGTGANGTVSAIARQIDGKIIIGGSFTTYNGLTANRIIRLNADGTRDGTFTGIGTNGTVNAIAIQGNGKIIIGGSFTAYNGLTANYITRLNTDGTRDGTFAGTGINSTVNAIAIQGDGKIVIGGSFYYYNEDYGNDISYIGRLYSDGTWDYEFNADYDYCYCYSPFGTNGTVNAVSIQSDGKIIIGGSFSTYADYNNRYGYTANSIIRLNSDGTGDGTFPSNGANSTVKAIAIQGDGKIIIGGDFNAYNGSAGINRITRLNSNGQRDFTFTTSTGANSTVNAIAIQGDGKILIGGSFTTYNGSSGINRIARLNAGGTLDGSFNAGGVGANNTVSAVAVQSDGKIIIGGSFTTVNAETANRIARLDPLFLQSGNCPPGRIINYTPTATDNCPGQVVQLQQTQGLPGGSPFPVGTTTNVFVATDIYGNSSTKSFAVIITESGPSCTITITFNTNTSTPPVITCPPNIFVNNTAGQCGANVSFTGINAATATGTPTPTIYYSPASGSFFPVGTTTVIATATNTSGIATCTFNVVVTDNQPPVLNDPLHSCSDLNQSLVNECLSTATDFDANTLVATVKALYHDNCGTVTATLIKTSPGVDNSNCSWSFIYTYEIEDGNGNAVLCNVIRSGGDTEPPTFTRPADKVIPFTTTCDYNSSPTYTGNPSAITDNCGGTVTISYSDATVQCGNNTVITRTWTATDACGNSSSEVQTITVTDNNTHYIIYAAKEAKFGENNIINGDVGVTNANGKAVFKKGCVLDPNDVYAINITVQLPSMVNLINQHFVQATDGPNPPFYSYTGGGLSGNHNQTVNGTVPVGNFKNLTIKKGVVATVNGSNYGKITIEEGASAMFTSSSINMEDLHVKKGKHGGSTTNIYFTGCTGVKVKDRVNIEENCRVNVGGPKVIFYLSDAKKDEEGFTVKGNNTQVTLNIMIPNGKLKVNGGDDVNCIMTGWFIVEKFESDGKNITWNPYDCAVPLASMVTKGNSIEEKVSSVTKEEPFAVSVSPNPSASVFNILVKGNSDELLSIRILDLSGRELEVRSGINRESIVTVGRNLASGTYYAEVIQGSNRQVVKLVKLN